MFHAVRNFLRLFEDSTLAEERTLKRLSDSLDRLLIAYDELANVAPLTDKLPPSGCYADDRQLMTRCFPALGLYGWSAPEARPGDGVMVGDAIDDLADIYAELRGVAWLSTNSSPEDATWQFRQGFQTHWGRHLINLRSYLHWKLHEPQ